MAEPKDMLKVIWAEEGGVQLAVRKLANGAACILIMEDDKTATATLAPWRWKQLIEWCSHG